MAVHPREALRRRVLILAGLLLPAAGPLAAQSLNEGALQGEVVLANGTTIQGVVLTLQDVGGAARWDLRSDYRGRFSVPSLPAGQYQMLAERAGFQPARQHGITVIAGGVTDLRIRLTQRPPPITSVEDIPVADQRVVPSGPRIAETIDPSGLEWAGRRLELGEAGRGTSLLPEALGTAWGVASSVEGRPPAETQLFVDGLPGTWLRHPAIPGQPAGAPVYPRYLLSQTQFLSNPVDVEWNGGTAGTLSAFSRGASDRFRFEPFVRGSASPGVQSALNPADSSLTSFQAGAVLSGTLVENKAHFVAGFGYEELELPTARPWGRDSAGFGGATVPLAATLGAIARDSFGVNANAQTAPQVRAYRGGAGGARIDWRLSNHHVLNFKTNVARWRERKTEAVEDLMNGAAGQLEARDAVLGVSLVSTFSGSANEARIGFRRNRREWHGAGQPSTYLVGEGAALGSSPAWPATFQRTSADISEVYQYSFGLRGQNAIKLGTQVSLIRWEQNYLYGRHGVFWFGDLDQFGNGRGGFFGASAPRTGVSFNSTEIGLFGQFNWQVSDRFELLSGLRVERQRLPASPMRRDSTFETDFGIRNDRFPDPPVYLAPRLGFQWVGGQGNEWLVIGGATLSRTYFDPALLSEAILYDGPVTVQRGLGSFAWPATPDTSLAPDAGKRFAVFDPQGRSKAPRAARLDAQIRRQLGGGVNLSVHGGYHYTDYLLRRRDLNLLPAPTGTTQEGRPVYGTLVQQGGLVLPQPGSNRRLAGYDLVSAIASTGFSEYIEGGLLLERQASRGVSFSLSYTWSRTRDNQLQTWTGDPADALNPFPQDPVGNEWAEGRSDFDIPHRVALSTSWQSAGRVPFTIGARYRFRSGNPYTPGFRPGVDVNGDGSGRNDPAFVDPNIAGLPAVIADHPCLDGQTGEFAERNSCRAAAHHALDLHLAVGLPVRSLGGRLEFTADLLNAASSASGVIDNALVLVDPAGTTTTDAQGNVTLPLIANPHFGKLQSRRDTPRMIWLGLRLGY